MEIKKILIICSVIIIVSCLITSFLIISHNNSQNEILESDNNYSTDTITNEIPENSNYHQYAADWYESYHIGGRYSGSCNPEFIATHDIFGLTQAPDGTYIIVAGDGCYYYVD